MPIQAWIDDSGGLGQSPVLVFAGWQATAEIWISFSADWTQCLAENPPIAYFKMNEASSRKGEFRGWQKEAVNNKLRQLARVIKKQDLMAFWHVIDMTAFTELTQRSFKKPFCYPYFWAYHQTILGLAYQLSSQGHAEQADIFFDDQVIFGPPATRWYPLIKESLKGDAMYNVLPAQMKLEDDKTSMPLQAADMLAWLINKCYMTQPVVGRNPSWEKNPFRWLVEQELPGVERAPSWQFSGHKRMMEALGDAYKRMANSELLEAYGFDDLPTDPKKRT